MKWMLHNTSAAVSCYGWYFSRNKTKTGQKMTQGLGKTNLRYCKECTRSLRIIRMTILNQFRFCGKNNIFKRTVQKCYFPMKGSRFEGHT